MSARNLNYYGYDKVTYQDCLSLIHSTNRKHVGILNLWFCFVNVAYLIFSLNNMFGVTDKKSSFYTVYVGIAVAFEVLLLVFRRFMENHTVLTIYLSILIFVSYSIYSSISQPYMAATMFLVLIVLVALS